MHHDTSCLNGGSELGLTRVFVYVCVVVTQREQPLSCLVRKAVLPPSVFPHLSLHLCVLPLSSCQQHYAAGCLLSLLCMFTRMNALCSLLCVKYR